MIHLVGWIGLCNIQYITIRSITMFKEQINESLYDSIKIRKDTFTVYAVTEKIKDGRIVLNRDFNNKLIWSPEKQTLFIESCLLRIPLPNFYLSEGKNGKLTIIDGLQRLHTLKLFLDNTLLLSELYSFSSLSTRYQNRIEDTQLTMCILLPCSTYQTQYDLFKRVNSGIHFSR